MVPRLVHAGWNFGLGLTRAGLSCPCRTKIRFMAIYVPCLHSRAIISYRGQFYKGKFQYLRNFMPMFKSLKALMKFFYCQVIPEEWKLLVF